LKEAGVVGPRLNVLFGGAIGFEEVDRYDALARELDGIFSSWSMRRT
jgi:2-pyrone-4,6-dicarboxylate lactonase